MFLADQDGILGEWGMNNFFMYRPEFSNQFRLIVWDKSQAFVMGPGVSRSGTTSPTCPTRTATG